jgi:ATP-dependent Lon protease
MDISLDLPDVLPVLPIGNTVFFPHAVLPLQISGASDHIMLDDALATHRMLIVSTLAPQPRKIATVGLIRICRKAPDGTAHLILQGLARVRISEYLDHPPYQQARIQAFNTPPCDDRDCFPLHHRTLQLIEHFLQLQGAGHRAATILKQMSTPDAFLDLASYLICRDNSVQLRLLETPNLLIRYQLMICWLNQQIQDQTGFPPSQIKNQ